MRASATHSRPALGLGLAAARVIMGGGPALAAATATAGRGSASLACTDSWTGQGDAQNWNVAANWSTGKVPGSSSNVCITLTVPVNVFTYASIKINSLLLGARDDLNVLGTKKPIVATVAKSVTLTPGGVSGLALENATVDAAEIDNQGGSISGDVTCHVDSPDIIFSDGASLSADFGTTTVSSLHQLSDGTLSDVNMSVSQGAIVLPGDITKLVSSNVSLGMASAIETKSGATALAGLTSVDAQSSLTDQNNLTLTGSSFTADGPVIFNGATLAIDGPFTQAAGDLSLEPYATTPAVLDASKVTIDSGASFYGAGNINASLVNDGSADAAGGTLAVSGDYTQARRATYTSGSESTAGVLAVSGKATLAGEVSTVQEMPERGLSYPLITFGSLSGRFTKHTLGFTLSTQANAIDAVIEPQIAPSARTVAPGGTLTVQGASFRFSELVSIYLDHVAGKPLAQEVSGAGGDISPTVTIPAATAAGTHKLIAVDGAGDRATKKITVS